ncbi:hypothetical protein ONS95_007988 [Cadophora gregata]|uniref:uncharacterized protein n=1 Tax=Cadophora gregata TaxID=51156 RepID=UPI0026DACD1B|nr:uncharacterized protein ONS95_007988 [Cadophora gregata]KAK0119126.1 hypothetical protein ONS96_012193 [Cadophora gregata f. sp. sojae]KAK0126382.1 hypothetical protein ONS95_007988 [Cadophora gregata]
MTISAQIEIDASPEEVRHVFFDFEHWPEIKSDMIKAIARLPSHPDGPIEVNEQLAVNFGGITSNATVLANTLTEFRWRGDIFYVLSGEHTFRFEPSTPHPGKTLFISSEIPMRLLKLLAGPIGMQKMGEGFCEDFKKRVESVVKERKDGRTS